MPRVVACLFSGGKDSTYSLHWAVLQGFKVACLVTIHPIREDSWMFHRPCIELTRLQSKALGIPIIYRYTSGVKEVELGDLKKALKEAVDRCGIEGVVAGALLSDYQRMRISLISEELGIKTYVPIWRRSQENYMRELVRMGFKVLVTSVKSYGLPTTLVGKILDEDMVEQIIEKARKYGFNPAFEGGEAETLVIDAPLFRYMLRVDGEVVRVGSYEAYLKVKGAWLERKPSTPGH